MVSGWTWGCAKKHRKGAKTVVCGCGKMGSSEAQWLMRVDGKRDGC